MSERDTTYVLLAGLALGLTLTLTSPVRAGTTVLSEDVFGHGQTEADARRDALEKARDLVVALLQNRQPDAHRLASAAYLRDNRMVRELSHEPNYSSGRLGPLHRVTVHLEVGERDVRRMLQEDRVEQRHVLAAKVVGALVLLLAVLAAFFR